MRKILTIIAFILLAFGTKAQQSLISVNGWNAYVHVPWDYAANPSKSYPTIIFSPGVGEVGTTASAVIANGPGAYITQGWNGNVKVGSDSVKFIVISLQPPTTWPSFSSVDTRIQTLKGLYRIDSNRMNLTGLSMGGWVSMQYVTGDALGGPYYYAKRVASIVSVEGVQSSDNAPWPDRFDNFSLNGGKMLNFEQVNDYRRGDLAVARMNSVTAGSAQYIQTNFGGGGHCCWNSFYGGQGVTPTTFTLNGVSQNIYEWMAKQSRTVSVIAPPTVNAGTARTVTVNNVSLSGTVTPASGQTITGYSWTKLSGGSATIVSPASINTTVTGLSRGVYNFRLTVTQNDGQTAFDDVQITVSLAGVYYVSNSGNDGDNGLTTATAWRTINKLNTTSFVAGDSILFRKGDTWREYLVVSSSGSVGKNITYGSYGTGNKPQILGSDQVTGWVNVTGNIWKSTNTFSDPSLGLNHNGLEMNSSGNWAGAIYFMENNGSTSWANLEKYSQAELLTEYDWWWSANNIYVYSPTNPSTRYKAVEVSQRQKCINWNVKSYLTIDGLEVKFAALLGMSPGWPISNVTDLTVKNCDISFIGIKNAAPMGIQTHHSNFKFLNNNVHDCGRRGLSINDGGAGVAVLTQNILIDGNRFGNGNHTTGADIQVTAAGSWTRDITYSNNTTYDSLNKSVTAPVGYMSNQLFVSEQSGSTGKITNLKVHNNIFMYPTQSAMQIENVDSAYVYNNTMFGSNANATQYGFGILLSGAKTNHFDIKNNIFKGTADHTKNIQASALVLGSGVSTSQITSDYNLYYVTDPLVYLMNFANGSNKYYQSQWSTYKSAQGQDAHSVTPTDPLFVSATDLRLLPGSPAIASGVDVGLPFTGAAPNIGALNQVPGFKKVTLSSGGDGGIYFLNPPGINHVNAGDTICVPAGEYTYITFKNLHGTKQDSIYIFNCGGQVVVNGSLGTGACYNIQQSDFFRFSGAGTAGVFYGFKAYYSGGHTGSSTIGYQTSNYRADHFESYNTETGWLSKINPENDDPTTWRGGWTAKNVQYDNMLIRRSTGEGIYFMNTDMQTSVKVSGRDTLVQPVACDTLNFFNVITDSTGWDGIQIASSTHARVHNNQVTNYGLTNLSSQQAGIIFGGRCTGDVYNNLIKKGTGNGMQIAGYGLIKVYNNIIDSAGWDGTAQRQDALYIDDNPFPSSQYAGEKVYVFNNTIANAGRGAIWSPNSYSSMASGNKIQNNLLIAPAGINARDHYIDVPYAIFDTTSNMRISTLVGAHLSGDYTPTSSTHVLNGLDLSGYFTTDFYGTNWGTPFNSGAVKYLSSGVAPPTVSAGSSQTLPVDNTSVTATVGWAASHTGTILWTKVSGGSATITSPTSATTTITGLSRGTYVFNVEVTQDDAQTASSNITIVYTAAPTANAGVDQTITLPTNSKSLSGAATNASGTTATYLWTKVSGTGTQTISGSTTLSPTISGMATAGTYVFQLTVTQSDGQTASDNATITVNAMAVTPTVTNSGNQTIGINTAAITSSGTAAAGQSITGYLWTKISGVGTITSPTSQNTGLTGLSGTSTYRITVTQTDGQTGYSDLTITVNAAPTANAGSNQLIVLPTTSLSLTGSSTNAAGTTATYLWNKVSGSGTQTITNSTTLNPTISGFSTAGVYVFRLTVTQSDGQIKFDDVQVSVFDNPGTLPVIIRNFFIKRGKVIPKDDQ